MNQVLYSLGRNGVPNFNYRILFVIFILVGSILSVNIFVAVVNLKYMTVQRSI